MLDTWTDSEHRASASVLGSGFLESSMLKSANYSVSLGAVRRVVNKDRSRRTNHRPDRYIVWRKIDE